jgi:hypothetical protein
MHNTCVALSHLCSSEGLVQKEKYSEGALEYINPQCYNNSNEN